MRMLFGIIIGAALIVGVAFISDSWTGPISSSSATAGSSSTVPERRNMVNWDVVGENVRIVGQRVRETWTRLSQKVSS